MLFLHIELLEHCLVARVRFIMAFFKCKVSDKRLNNQDFDQKIFSCFTTDFCVLKDSNTLFYRLLNDY